VVIEEREFVIDIDTFHLSTVRNIEQLNNNTPVNTEVLWGGGVCRGPCARLRSAITPPTDGVQASLQSRLINAAQRELLSTLPTSTTRGGDAKEGQASGSRNDTHASVEHHCGAAVE